MIHLSIAQRFRPFSHVPGTCCVLPGSTLRFQIFPTRLCVHDLSQAEPILLTEIGNKIRGPVQHFTVVQDLEKGCIRVFGHCVDGYFRYAIYAIGPNNWCLREEKTFERGLEWESPIPEFAESAVFRPGIYSRLSLGVHKAPDWAKVMQRGDLAEIFPFWFYLGQMIPPIKGNILEKTMNLNDFHNLFLAGFQGILSPRLEDDQYQGIDLPINKHFSPLLLLKEGSAHILRLFFQENKEKMEILTSVPPKFHCGRLLHLPCGKGAILSIEWTKKSTRRIVLNAGQDEELPLVFEKGLKRFRLRKNFQDRGTILSCGTAVSVRAGETVFLDRFEK